VNADESVTTDDDGIATLADLAVSDALTVQAESDGLNYYGITAIEEDVVSTLTIEVLVPDQVTTTLSETETTEVNVGSSTVVLPTDGALETEDGTAYDGDVEVSVASVTAGSSAAVPPPAETNPSDDGSTPNVIDTFEVSLLDESGDPLQLSDGESITVTRQVDLDDAQQEAIDENDGDVALWRFDEELGIWVQEGTATLDDDVLTMDLPHLSFYTVWGGAFFTVVGEAESVCATGVTTAGAAVRFDFQIVCPSSGSIFNQRVQATADAAGAFCLNMPTGADVTCTVTTVRDRTPTIHNGVIRQMGYYIDGVRQSPLTLPTTGDPMCGAGATCATIGTPPAQVAPTCAANASVCDDSNACTTDTCDTALCAAGTTCTGCAHTPIPFAPSGGPTPTLTRLFEAGTYELDESFDDADRDSGALAFIDTNGARLDFAAGAMTIVDDETDPSERTAYSIGSEPITGGGTVTLDFAVLADTIDRGVSIEIDGPHNSSSEGMRVLFHRTWGGAAADYELRVFESVSGASQETPLPGALIAGDYTLEATFAAGSVSATLTPPAAVGGAVTITSTPPSGTLDAPWTFSFGVFADPNSGQTADIDVVALQDLDSDFSATRAEGLWTRTLSPMDFNGTTYNNVAGEPPVIWFTAAGFPEEDNPFAFAGTVANVYIHAVTDGTELRTVVTPMDRATFEGLLASALPTAVVNASAVGFVRQSDGTYLWQPSLLACRP